MNSLFAAAGSAQSRDLEYSIFVVSLGPPILYFLGVTLLWVVAHARSIRERKFRLRSLLILVAILSPGMALLRLIRWPHWWYLVGRGV